MRQIAPPPQPPPLPPKKARHVSPSLIEFRRLDTHIPYIHHRLVSRVQYYANIDNIVYYRGYGVRTRRVSSDRIKT